MAILAKTPDPTKTLFVICPIGADDSPERKASDQLMEYVIEPVASSAYKIERADKIMKTGSITSQIFDLLLNADVVVSDMTGHNANVFYELAVRHAVGKPVIHVIATGDRIPFDVADQRAIYYTLDLPGAKSARDSLTRMLAEIEQQDTEPPSPILAAFQRNLLSQSSNLGERRDAEMLSMLSDVRREIAAISTMGIFRRVAGDGVGVVTLLKSFSWVAEVILSEPLTHLDDTRDLGAFRDMLRAAKALFRIFGERGDLSPDDVKRFYVGYEELRLRMAGQTTLKDL